jgi:hypothetical protein
MASPWTEYGDCTKCGKAVSLVNPRHGDGSTRHTRWHKNAQGDWCRAEVPDGWRRTREPQRAARP